jgi:hypothetical protein
VLKSIESFIIFRFIKTFYELKEKGISDKNLFQSTVDTLKENGYYLNFKNDKI